MDLSDLLVIDAILPRLKTANKKQALQEMAAKAAALTGRDERDIFETLMQREKLGSTGVGHGVAIPHGKLAGLERLVGVFALLDKPIDFDSLDGEPVDVYIGDNPASKKIYIVDQRGPSDRGRFDELKVLLGMDNIQQAKETYTRAFTDGTGWQRLGAISAVTPSSAAAFCPG